MNRLEVDVGCRYCVVVTRPGMSVFVFKENL